MNDGTVTEADSQPSPGMTTRLMDSLIPLGEALPESHRPAPATLSHLLAGLLYWLETGSTEPPKIEAPTTTITTSKDAEIAQLKAELEAAQNAAAAKSDPVEASPVAPTLTPTDPVVASPAVAQPEAPSTEPPVAAPVPPVSDVPSAPAS